MIFRVAKLPSRLPVGAHPRSPPGCHQSPAPAIARPRQPSPARDAQWVAIVPLSKNTRYPGEPAVLTGRDGRPVEVADPGPVASRRHRRRMLEDNLCQRVFEQLAHKIDSRMCDVVMSEAQMFGEHSVVLSRVYGQSLRVPSHVADCVTKYKPFVLA